MSDKDAIAKCGFCSGSGTDPNPPRVTKRPCRVCGGKGWVRI